METTHRILIAGATGVIGRRLVDSLSAAGHEVHGLARNEASAELIRSRGGAPVSGDLLDAESVERAVAHVRPTVVLHQATALKHVSPRKLETIDPTNRLRTEGTRNLVRAAERHGVQRLVAQGIAFAYAHEGPDVLAEDAPLDVHAPGAWGAVARAVAVNEETVMAASNLVGVVLRYGQFYGPQTGTFPEGHLADLVRTRRMPIIGGGGGRFSFIHIDDAVSATLHAIDGGWGAYNIVDDQPTPASEFIPALAEALGAPAPRRISAWLARPLAGQHGVSTMTTQRGASNLRAKAELGWRPEYPGWREGIGRTGGAPETTLAAGA
jgi:nucleoside-diphosphate-sugar epimerase